MAKVYLIPALIVFQGLFFFFDVTSTQSSSLSASVSVSISTSMSASVSDSVSASVSPSTSASVSPSVSPSTSASVSPSTSASVSTSPQPSVSASVSPSTSVSVSPSTSTSVSTSPQPSVSASPSASTSVSMSPSQSTSVSTSPQPSVSTSPQPSVSTSPQPSVSTSPQPSVSTSPQPSSVSTSPQPSPSTPTTPPPTTPTIPPPIGSTVLFCLRIKVFHCNSSIHGINLPETNSLFANLTTNVKTLYTKNAQNVSFTSISCGSAKYVILYFLVAFNQGFPNGKYIETILKEEIQDNKLGDLPVDGSFYNVTFVGINPFTYTIKDGECNRICCGAGGPVVLVRVCTPVNKCEGILPKTKEGTGYCHGEQNDSCTGKVTCTPVEPPADKACSSHFPSFAVLILLALASFLTSTVY